MNVVHISPHYPAHYSLFAEKLAQRGVNVLGITDQKDEALSPALRKSLVAHYRVDQIDDFDQIRDACRFFQKGWGSLDRVESHLEPWIELEARIREEFGVSGLKPENIQFLKRKFLMKKVFEDARVPTARGTLVESMSQCLDFIGGRYPVFIKPDIGVGASDTYTIRSQDDLERFFREKGPHPYFLEEYLSGVIESFDGLTDRDGTPVFFTSHVFSNDIHRIVHQDENLWYYCFRMIPPDLEEMGKRVVAAAGIREKFFHIEFFRCPDGQLKGLETNIRPPGGLTTHMFNYGHDIDVYDWWASIVAGEPSKRPFERRYHCAYVGRKYNRAYVNSHEAIRERFGGRVVHSQPMNPIEFAVMGNYAYLVRSPDEQEVLEMTRFITAEA